MDLKINCIICVVILCCLPMFTKALSGPNVCPYRVSRTYSYTVSVPYRAYESYRTCCSHFMWCWKKCTRYRPVTRYRYETRYSITYSSYDRCCTGWAQVNNRCQTPICNRPSCVHGTCVRPNTCSCNTGYESPSTGCRSDINECHTSNGGCDQTCHNLPGSHSCSCRRGYTLHIGRRCQDIDECTISNRLCECYDLANNPTCTATCHNTVGSYRCTCSSGYHLATAGKCADINECLHYNAGCSQICSNLPGSHRCSCHIGYQLQSDGKSCSDINECTTNNGGCEHVCHNNIGSFQCQCRPGHVLDFNHRTCSDIDECISHPHGCEHICNNYKGGYFCSCRLGYRLKVDNKTCTDIDECNEMQPDTNITFSKCAQKCHNTIGSYTCSCNAGYRLASDGKVCNDVDECTAGSHSCQQTCINTLGSYVCKCVQGYRLNSDGKACDALPCIRHPPIVNGRGTCFVGKTGDSCSFSCHPGFDLRGSSLRQCQNNHTWSGSLPTCSRKDCNELSPPANGGLELPCFKYYQASCKVKCNTGYFAVGSSKRTCLASRNNTMYWSSSATRCQEISVCGPNPCKHNGICDIVNKDTFRCDCGNTGYRGKTCDEGIVKLPGFPQLHPGKTYNFRAHAKPDNDLKITITSNDDTLAITPSTILFDSITTHAVFQLYSSSSGMKALSFRLHGSDASDFKAPVTQAIYVQDPSPHLDNVISSTGALSQGCHDQVMTVVDRQIKNINLHSTAPWTDQAGKVTTSGVLVMDVDGATLPASLVGSSIINDNLVNSKLEDFINNYTSDRLAGAKNLTVEETERCVSEKPSTAYLSDVVKVNAVPKTVADGVNQNTPAWINLIPQQTVTTFDTQDYTANILRGQDIKEQHNKCGDVLTTIENDQRYYMYSTNQKMLMHVNDEDVHVGSGAQICILRSVSENETVIGFSNASKILKTLESSTGWKIKANGMDFKNTSMGSVYKIFGQFSTEMSSDSAQVKIAITGDIKFVVINDTAFSVDGISETRSMSATGKISMNVTSSLPGSEENSAFIGQGKINMTLTDSSREVSVFLNRTDDSTRALANGSVYLDKRDLLVYKVTVSDSGGEIKTTQNTMHYFSTYIQAKKWTNETKQQLEVISSEYRMLRSFTRPIIQNLNVVEHRAMQLSLSANRTMGSSMYQPLVELKGLVSLIERQMQVLWFKHREQNSTITEVDYMLAFEQSTNRLKESCQVPLERENISRTILSRTLIDQGLICLDKLCFGKSKLEISYDISSDMLGKLYGIKFTPHSSCTAIIGRMEKEVTLGGLVSVPTYSAILQVINTAKVKQGFLNGTIDMYGKKTPMTVKYTEGLLEFSALVLLPDGSQCNILADADITKVVYENEVVFNIAAQAKSNANIVKKINHSLKERLISISRDVTRRIHGLQKAVRIYDQQRTKAIENQIEKKRVYDNKLQQLHKLEVKINKTKRENALLKSRVIREMRAYDSAAINYTRGIEQCPPRVCISKCVPGLIRSICFKERFEHVITQSCTLEKKKYAQTEFNTVASHRQYVSQYPKTRCSTRCPPLTGLFKSIFGKRKRRELSTSPDYKERRLIRRKRGIFTVLLSKVAQKLITKGAQVLFGYLGGENGKLGAQIGGALPGPAGIAGSIVGGVVGSIFGKCDKLCQTTLIPQLNDYIHYEVVKEIKSMSYSESVCTDIPVRQKLGYMDEHECFRWSNCSDAITDVECLNHNERCRSIRLLMNDKIKREGRLASGYAAYQQNSLELEAMGVKKMRVIREKNNAYQSLSAAKVISFKANITYNVTRQALANANKLLATEIKLSKLVERMGVDVISVQNARFSYRHSVGARAPKIVYLLMDVVQKDGKSYVVDSLYDFGNENQSKVDAVRQIIKTASSKELSRKRRAITNVKSFDSKISVDEVSKTDNKNRCKDVDADSMYLIEVATILRDDASQFQRMQQAIKEAQEMAKNHTKSTIDVAASSNLCNADLGCSNQWLAGLYTNATALGNETANETLTWDSKRAEMFANIQQFTKNQNFTKCGGVFDCVPMSITSISDAIQYDNSDLSEVARRHIAELQPYFNQIFENSSLNANQTRDLANKILKSIALSSARRLFCDPPPVILRDLPTTLIVTSEEVSSLSINVESIHKLNFKWMKNGEEIHNSNSKTLAFSSNNHTVTGYYNCEISNKFGKVLSATTKVEYQEIPHITKHPQGQTTTLRAPNATIVLTCNATGTPSPSIAWHFTPFNSSRETTLKGNETMLKVNATSVEQSGWYRCSASNNQGKVTSHGARVHVKESMIATFSTEVSFIVVLKTSSNYTNGTKTENNTAGSTNVTQSTEMNHTLPKHLSANDTKGLQDLLAKHMNITRSRIKKIVYVRHTDTRASISFEIAMQNMDPILEKYNDWTKMSEDMVMARKGLLVLPVWLYTLYNNISSSFNIGNLETNVLPETMESTMNEASCPVRFSLKSNGFICDSCTAGTMYVPGTGCEHCPLGKYQPEQKMLTCIPCQTNYTTKSQGAVETRDCVPIDIDECAMSRPVCSCNDPINNPRCIATCHNTIGSYNCSCSDGYRLDASGNCTDVDECLHYNGGCFQSCSNTPGSYLCSCHKGYLLQSDGKNCSDINECLRNNGGCEHLCINNIGSFHCQCRPGYDLDHNGRACSATMKPTTKPTDTPKVTKIDDTTKKRLGTTPSTIEEPSKGKQGSNKDLALMVAVPIVAVIILVALVVVLIRAKRRPNKENSHRKRLKTNSIDSCHALRFENPIYAGDTLEETNHLQDFENPGYNCIQI